MLTETEKTLLLATDRAALSELDEDDLVALHDRVRRARNKYSKLYRRRAREQVAKDAARGRAQLVNERPIEARSDSRRSHRGPTPARSWPS
jgi:hypothetical protein